MYQGLQSIPECTVDELKEADGVLFGSLTRYGNMDAQMKTLTDSTVQLWLTGAWRETCRRLHLDGFDPWRSGDYPAHHNGSFAAPSHGDRWNPLLNSWHDSHGGSRRNTLRRNDDCRATGTRQVCLEPNAFALSWLSCQHSPHEGGALSDATAAPRTVA